MRAIHICFVCISLGCCFFGRLAGGNTVLDVKRTAHVIHVGSVHLSLGRLLRCRWTAFTTEGMSRAKQYCVFVWQLKQRQHITFLNKTFT